MGLEQGGIRRVECLDGLRGLAALWVLIGHMMILTGFRLPLLSKPDLGVDLFILLSGFLMVFQYQLRSGSEDWNAPGTWASFWARRFFRLAPLFYVTLAAALIAGPAIYESRVAIDSFLGQGLQPAERYTDASLANVAAHLSFVFGLLPDYAFRTPLPDWSLGLEMQFYAAFPFLVLLARRTGWVPAALIAAGIGVGLALAAGAAGLDWPMPSFLPLKLHLFLCGMLIAADPGSGKRIWVHLVAAVLLAAIPIGGEQDVLHFVVREGVVLGFFALVHLRSLGAIDGVARLLGNKPFHWLGELSYGTYLIHLLILQPVAGAVIGHFGTGLGALGRFVLTGAVVVPLTYALAFVTYKLVELPGQRLGKAVIRRVTGSAGRARQTVPEELAAP
ncbi:peptidoglycan/LPS O-acetylase OafA/YrhL [Sphingomonas kyeonggiensis]|uniref:Peptidoglycan/LPS O-acetylase OafA/YrhL n=1 Tax=Sphingomonas kyeonggiensis TaxID=1268553 RepID=A0A7W7K422_9SPHN|nr:acyltransferase [Sphingomonas kyeonggiensis]MBB4840654.1 peptidoglycan/LPS O-acetylase OafA/YrhL [Sphingomonas kyeonggiensis]